MPRRFAKRAINGRGIILSLVKVAVELLAFCLDIKMINLRVQKVSYIHKA